MPEHATSTPSAATRFHCVTVETPDPDAADRVLAEAMAVGASGAEQRDSETGVTLLLYATDAALEAVRRAAVAAAGEGAVGVRAVVARDWSEAWKAGLRAVEVSPRLRVRPSFDESPARPAQHDLVIDPGQAFGTGGHESTRLALAWLDALRDAPCPGRVVLDVGTGSGVLALAALILGAAERAVAFDLDPLAAPAARANGAVNGVGTSLGLFTGPLDALEPGARFGGIAANLLRRELEPLVTGLADRVAPGGWVVVSGLLDGEVDAFAARCAASGLALEGVRRARDESGALWAGLFMRPRGSARG